MSELRTVVTYLECSEPPRRHPPMPSGLQLALMRVRDIPLHFYRYLYAEIGGPYSWIERADMDDETLASAIRRPGIEITVLYADGAPAGYYELDFAAPDVTDLVYFGLMPHVIGRGIGPWLLCTAMVEGFSRGASKMSVNTCTLDHPAALRLYQRMGFSPVGQEERVLSDSS